jgi:gamma-glutamyltranspeptidase
LMKPFLITPEQASELPVYLATEPGIEKLSGSYFKDGKPVKVGDKVTNPEQGKALMEFSEKLVQPFLAEKVIV